MFYAREKIHITMNIKEKLRNNEVITQYFTNKVHEKIVEYFLT